MFSRTLTVPYVVLTDHSAAERYASAVAAVTRAWRMLQSFAERLLARQRLSRSIAHLDDRMLADIGLTPRNRGLGENLIRKFAAGGQMWRGDE